MRRKRHLVLAACALRVAARAGLYLARRLTRTEAETRARLGRLSPAPRDLNLVVFTRDTTRADRLGCYGFAGVETPNINSLASEGVLFEHATAVVPLTFPSHSSIFTGLLPPHHGGRDNGGFLSDQAKNFAA